MKRPKEIKLVATRISKGLKAEINITKMPLTEFGGEVCLENFLSHIL